MPLRQSVTYTVAGRSHTADLYLPCTLDGCVVPASAESRDAAALGCPRAACVRVTARRGLNLEVEQIMTTSAGSGKP